IRKHRSEQTHHRRGRQGSHRQMRRALRATTITAAALACTMSLAWVRTRAVSAQTLTPAPSAADAADQLAIHRNLGKAFYENPTTYAQAVEEFTKALALAPDSVRERVNLGLALQRAGKTAEGVAELKKAQQQDPKLPHTWFNLGIQYKKDG